MTDLTHFYKKFRPVLMGFSLALSVFSNSRSIGATGTISGETTNPAANPPVTGDPASTGGKTTSSAGSGNSTASPSALSGPEFKKNLSLMYENAEKTIKILREQIIQNQSAPFLADLYLQLGDRLSQKSNVLYFQKMEKDPQATLQINNDKLNPIVSNQQEAISVYKKILKEFPSFNKRDRVLYRLALAQQSIDETAAFLATAEKLVKDFPESKESMQVRLLMGQHFFDQHDFAEAMKILLPVTKATFAYERNAAKYRVGLIFINQEKFKDALEFFEQVCTDAELKEDDNPLELNVQSRKVKSNIKREALVDSVRAYTEVHKESSDPVQYYSGIAPTESLFQEAIEKLAYRYIFLKKEAMAMKLLRVLSERVADPQKVVNIYQEVLLMIPPLERIEVPVAEIQYVLSKYSHWISFYDVKQNVKGASYKFFETQVRELGTKSHDLAKAEFGKTRKDLLYERARQFYSLYLGYFEKSPEAVKIAINLGDVYYQQRNFLKSGDYYIRVFNKEFGNPTSSDTLLQNAILCFQKEAPSDYYDLTRQKGLLVKAIQMYMAFDRSKQKDPQLNFALAKTFYEQGLYDRALDDLLNYARNFPQASKEVQAAIDILLDYFNTRSDFDGLAQWTQKLLGIRTLSEAQRKKLQSVRDKALARKLDEDVKTKKDYDPFSQGKIYFEAALDLDDKALRSVALEQALARSKSERDIDTFLKAAGLLAKDELKSDKRTNIYLSMAEETLALGRYYKTIEIWKALLQDSKIPVKQKTLVSDKILRLALMLKDWNLIQSIHSSPLYQLTSNTLKADLEKQIVGFLGSPIQTGSISGLRLNELSTEEILVCLKSQTRLSPRDRSTLQMMLNKSCAAEASSPLCKWSLGYTFESSIVNFVKKVRSSPREPAAVEVLANQFSQISGLSERINGSGDPILDIYLSLGMSRIYSEFGQFLLALAKRHPEMAQALNSKANETIALSKNLKAQCSRVINVSNVISPANAYCAKGDLPPRLENFTQWNRPLKSSATTVDPKDSEIHDIEKSLFLDHTKSQGYLKLSEAFLKKGHYHHALASAQYGLNTFSDSRDSFSILIGCALGGLGFLSEGQILLKGSGTHTALSTQCLTSIQRKAASL